MLTVLVKLLFSGATLAFLLGFAPRWAATAAGRRRMTLGLALAVAGALVATLGLAQPGVEPVPARWALGLAGDGVRWLLLAHAVLTGLALLGLGAEVVTGLLRRALHGLASMAIMALWLATYALGMFLYL